MQRLKKDERGAVAIIVALLMVVLIGVAALAIDVSAMWMEKRQLQNGADAGALAIAQDCAKDACGSMNGTAQTYVDANRTVGDPTGTADKDGNSVTVTASDPHDYWFARMSQDEDSKVISAEATAEWGWPTGGATLPLIFSWCEWNAQGGLGGLDNPDQRKIVLPKKSDAPGCDGPSGNPLPGGFGWLDNSGGCRTTSGAGGEVGSSPGNNPSCSEAEIKSMIGKTLLIPIYGDAGGDDGGKGGTGSHGWYVVYGYAAFTLTGYDFKGKYTEWPSGVDSCKGSERCIAGHFVRYVDLNEVQEIGSGPKLGAVIVTLTLTK